MRRFLSIIIPVQLALLAGCSTLPLDSSENSSWSQSGIGKLRGTIRIISVSADKSGEWGSLEKEIADLLPLLFSEESYRVVPASEEADYCAEVKAREREYPVGWRTKRSLSVEVRLWRGNTSGPLPLSAGRSLIQGKQSLASSKTTSAMLRKAIKNAIRGLKNQAGFNDLAVL